MLGDVLSRVRSVDSVRRFVTDQAAPLVIDLLVGIVTAALMVTFSPHLAFIVIMGLLYRKRRPPLHSAQAARTL